MEQWFPEATSSTVGLYVVGLYVPLALAQDGHAAVERGWLRTSLLANSSLAKGRPAGRLPLRC
eukprot:COSAG01_NODE_11883_length_1841_cov_8.739380_2_plen_62_part_01